jgi:hypothetical protein
MSLLTEGQVGLNLIHALLNLKVFFYQTACQLPFTCRRTCAHGLMAGGKSFGLTWNKPSMQWPRP